MLRRILLAFVGFCLLVLALTVGYAALGLSGPATAIAEAERLLAAGEYTAAITQLDLAEQELHAGGDPALLERLLRQRREAWRRTSNWTRALADTDRLLAEHVPGDAELTLDRIWLLLQDGRAEDGLAAARAFLDRNPGHGNAIELAGEANQVLYQAEVRQLVAELKRKLPASDHARALAALRPYLFTGGDDPVGERGKAEFDAILARASLPDAASGRYENWLRRLRGRIQQAQSDFAQSLIAPGHFPVNAYRGLAFALEQGRRPDDLIALSEIYLRRFDHVHAVEAAANLARAHFDAGRMAAVVEIADRFLPPGRIEERLAAGTLSLHVRSLILFKARALHALGDSAKLLQLLDEAGRLDRTGRIPMWPFLHLPWGLACDLVQNWTETEAHLSAWQRATENRGPAPEDGDDLFTLANKLRLRASLARGDDRTRTLAIFSDWLGARGEAAEPYLWRACYHLERGDGAEAFNDARQAFARSVQDEHALLVRAAAADLNLQPLERDAAALLEHCRTRRVDLPSQELVADDALYVTLAQVALRREVPSVARAAARRAAERFPWAREPRLLQAQAALALDDAEDALLAIDVLRSQSPGAPDHLDLERQALRRLGREATALAFDFARRTPPVLRPLRLTELLARATPTPVPTDADLTVELLRRALARGDTRLGARIAERAGREHTGDPRLLLQVAELEGRLGELDLSRRLFDQVLGATRASDRTTAARAASRLLLLEAAAPDSERIPDLVATLHDLLRDRPDDCHELAAALATAGFPAIAYDVLRPLLVESGRGARAGRSFLLGGRLALELDQLPAAERHLTAALTFPDGAEASVPLAHLLVLQDRAAEASEALLLEAPREVGEAALFLRTGRDAPASSWLREAQAKEPTSVPLLACLAAADPAQSPDPDLRRLGEGDHDLLLDLLGRTGVRGLERIAVRDGERLVERHPQNRFARFLHARALAAARRFDPAITLLNELIAADGDFLPAFDELVRLLQQTGSPQLLDPQFADRMLALVAKAPALASPRLLAQTGRELAVRLLREGASQQAIAVLAQIWVQYPDAAQAGVDEIAALALTGRRSEAFEVLDALGDRWPRESLGGYFDLYFGAAPELIVEAPEQLETIRSRADSALSRHGAYGAVVHFLLDDEERRLGPVPARRSPEDDERVARARAMLHAQVDLFRAGRDASVPHVRRSLERLARFDSPRVALARTTELLRRDPSLIELWLLRARLNDRLGEPLEAERDLRWINRYLAEPAALFELALLGGAAGRHDRDTEERLFRELSPELAESPPAQLALGMLALRAADYPRAEALLANAAPQPDGGHLYWRALANLALPGPEAAGRAIDLYDRLDRDYASSSLARNAGLFEAQLVLP